LLCKVPIFFIRRLASRRVYQKEKKQVGVAAFENYSPTPNFIIFKTDEETDFKRIRERNF
jgi:hypothetical protein